jgi:hypothetical protein
VKKAPNFVEIEIDKLTNSIENVISSDSFATNVLSLTREDLKSINKKNGWKFDWKSELLKPDRDVYKLCIANNNQVVQGLVSLALTPDHVYMHLVENAPFNVGIDKVYAGVAGNLIAFACKLSFQHGTEGYVSFRAKTILIDHYVSKLGAIHYGGHLLILDTKAALNLLNKYKL